MIGVALLIAAAKIYQRGLQVNDETAASILLSRAESMEELGTRTIVAAGILLAFLWFVHGAAMMIGACGHTSAAETLDSWVLISVLIALAI